MFSIGLLILLLLFVISLMALKSQRQQVKQVDSDVLRVNSQYIYNQLRRHGLNDTVARFATAQAAFETGGFTSNSFLYGGNAFGYKHVGQPLSRGVIHGHAHYSTIADSCQEFVEYWKRRRRRQPLPVRISSLRVFVEYLGDKNIQPGAYFEVSIGHYLNGVTYYYKQIWE